MVKCFYSTRDEDQNKKIEIKMEIYIKKIEEVKLDETSGEYYISKVTVHHHHFYHIMKLNL